jgi:hypothetical protein
VVMLAIPAPTWDVPAVEQRLLKKEPNLMTWVAAVNADLRAMQRRVRSLVVSRSQQRQDS